MNRKNGHSSHQVNNSNQEEKSQAALQLFREFISNLSDPDPVANRQILSELLTIGFKNRPHQDDEEYSDTAGRLSEALRDLLNGMIDNGLDDQVGDPGAGQAEPGSGNFFDLSGLDTFLASGRPEPLELAQAFSKLVAGFTDLLAQTHYENYVNNANFFVMGHDCTNDLAHLVDMFEVFREIKEVRS